jgi:LAS superfamily LD-carboxypeptidase LdcB
MPERNKEHTNPQVEHESPFFEQELFVDDSEPELEMHLTALEEESLWRNVFTQRTEFGTDSNFNKIKDSDQDRFIDEEAWLEDEGAEELEDTMSSEIVDNNSDTSEVKWLNLEKEQYETNRRGRTYVKWLQQSLNRILGLQMAEDGIIGNQTRTAIRNFQKLRGLKADGIVGRMTEAALIAAGAEQPFSAISSTLPKEPRTPTDFVAVPVENPGGGRIQDKRDPNPNDLVTVIGVRGRRIQLQRHAAAAWRAMINAARSDGIREPLLLPVSGYRSSKYQAQLFQKAVEKYGSETEARKWVAPPGRSAHQSGRAIDLYLGGSNTSGNVSALRKTSAYSWLENNAIRFGFYPYEREPWHWEYNPLANIEENKEIYDTFVSDEVFDLVEDENQLWELQDFEEELFDGEFDTFEEVREADEEWEEDTLMDKAAFSEDGPNMESEIWPETAEKYEAYSWEESYPQEESAFEEEFFGDTEEADAILENPVELELSSEVTFSITAFITQLGIEWAQKRQKKSPSAEEISNWLLKDYKDTLEGARLRYKKRYGKGKFTVDAIGRAWMISRRDQMNFVTSSAVGIRPLQNFAPPIKEVSLISSKLIYGSDKAPVAPIIVRFVEDLQSRYQGHLRVTNYPGHGGGKFNNRGYSLDLWLKNVDDRGFYVYKDAINLLRAVDQASNTVQTEWRMIYNDFSVADAINRETGKKHVIFVGKVRRGNNRRVTGLNWHGPDPLILHFHLDLAPRKEVRDTGRTKSSDPDRSSTLDYQKAIRLNRHYGSNLGWQDRLHEINIIIGLASNTPVERDFVDAVSKWQKVQGLKADGILGPNTWRRLRPQLVNV